MSQPKDDLIDRWNTESANGRSGPGIPGPEASHETAGASSIGAIDVQSVESLDQLLASIKVRSRGPAGRFFSSCARLWPLVVFFAIWELISILGQRSNPQFDVIFPPPTAAFSAARHLILRGELFSNIIVSVQRVLVAVAGAAILGIPLGLFMGWWPKFKEIADPILEFIRPIPPLAWIPLSILWFGTGNTQIEFIIFLAAFFPIVLNSMAGARGIDPYLVRAGLSFGARGWTLFHTVILRGSLPSIMTGVRIGLGIGWMALVAGELVAAHSGLGYMINNAQLIFRSDIILLGMVLIGMLGILLDYCVRILENVIVPWNLRK